MDIFKTSQLIKEEAFRLGFDACGICRAEYTGIHAQYLKQWLEKGRQAGMSYMSNHFEKRANPALLVENAKSVIVVALNYYPSVKQNPEVPQFSYYAYGKDYHEVIKEKLHCLFQYISLEIKETAGRVFCDSAPVLEKYHAQKAGLGWIGKHTQLIIPGKGSYFFLGCIICDLELSYDFSMENHCGNCVKCMQACPTGAIEEPYLLNSRKCISYLTIEHEGDFPENTPQHFCNYIFGCDICNQACPWNRKFAKPCREEAFIPSSDFLQLDYESVAYMSNEKFNHIFKYSPVKRSKMERIKRNLTKWIN